MNRIGMIVVLLALVAGVAVRAGGAADRVIEITAKRFEYQPAEVHVRAGEPIVFALRSLDRQHGFSLPDFHLRTDIPAGATVRLPWTPTTRGHFEFSCDVYCGSGHEGMSGTLIVE